MEVFMKTLKVGALALGMMFAVGYTVEAKTTYNPIKLIKRFDKKVLRPNMEFYARGSEYVAQLVQRVFGVRAGCAVSAGLMVPYAYPTAAIITTIAVVTTGVIAYKKYTASKKKIETEDTQEEDEDHFGEIVE
jgi:hypothetical protein